MREAENCLHDIIRDGLLKGKQVLGNEPVERRKKGPEGRLTWGWWMET